MNEVDETNPLGTLIVHVKSYEFILNSCGAEVVNQLTDAQTLTLARLIKILISFIRHKLTLIFILLSSVLMQWRSQSDQTTDRQRRHETLMLCTHNTFCAV